MQKASLCVCPEEAPTDVFEQDITTHLAIPKQQPRFFCMQDRECFHGSPKKVVPQFSSRLASSVAVGIYLVVQISAGLPPCCSAAEYLNRVQIVKPAFNS